MKHGQPGKPIRNSAGLTSATAERPSLGMPTALRGGMLQRLLLETARHQPKEGGKLPFKTWTLNWLEFRRFPSEEEQPIPEYHWSKHRLNDPKRWKGMSPYRATLFQIGLVQM